MYPAAIAQSIRMLGSSVDIYLIRTNAAGCRALLEKGFCADLSGEEGLVRQVEELPGCFAEAVTVDGKLRGIPYGVVFGSFDTLGCSQSTFDALGVSISDLPSNTDELLDCILAWIAEGRLDDFWLNDLHQERAMLYRLALNGYIQEAAAYLKSVLQEMEPEAALLLWPVRAEPVENPDYRQQAEAYQQEALRL